MLPQSSEFDASFQGKDNGEKPVKYLCLPDTRSQLLLKKQDSNKTCSHHISQIRLKLRLKRNKSFQTTGKNMEGT